MIVKRFVCDRCSKDIEGDNVFTIAIEEKPKDNLDDFGEFEESLVDAHFCLDCKKMILAYIRNEVHENVKIEPIVDSFVPIQNDFEPDWEPEELKQPYTPEVVQENAPSKRQRSTQTKVEQDRDMARKFYAAGKPIGEIARSLGHTYQCIKNWVQ